MAVKIIVTIFNLLALDHATWEECTAQTLYKTSLNLRPQHFTTNRLKLTSHVHSSISHSTCATAAAQNLDSALAQCFNLNKLTFGRAGDMALVQALMQLNGDSGVGIRAADKTLSEAEQERGQCLRARHVAAHRSCDSASECAQVSALHRAISGHQGFRHRVQ